MGEGLGVRYAQYASEWAGVNLICMCFPDRDEIDKERGREGEREGERERERESWLGA